MSEDMKIGHLTTLYHTSFILRASGRMANQGIKGSWKLFPNGPAIVEAFEKNEIDVGYIGLPPAMIGIGRGLKIKCIAGRHVEGTVLIGSRDLILDAMQDVEVDCACGTPHQAVLARCQMRSKILLPPSKI